MWRFPDAEPQEVTGEVDYYDEADDQNEKA